MKLLRKMKQFALNISAGNLIIIVEIVDTFGFAMHHSLLINKSRREKKQMKKKTHSILFVRLNSLEPGYIKF